MGYVRQTAKQRKREERARQKWIVAQGTSPNRHERRKQAKGKPTT